MGKCFRSDDLNQALLLPPSLHDWLPEKHLARFLVDVVDALDLSAIHASYEEGDGRGQSAYAPEMMVRVLLYGYTTGIYSSRRIQAKTYEDVAFRYLSADKHPDHSTLAEFRKRHLGALAALFTQALQLCRKAGLVKLGHVAIDGTKLQGNASKHKAMSYGRMGEAEKKLKEEVDELMKRAEAVDAAEDEKYAVGEDPGGQGGVGSRSPRASRGAESGGRGQDRRTPGTRGTHGQEDARAGGRRNWTHIGHEKAGPRVAAILPIVETCRRLKIPVREYLAAVLPGLANSSIQNLPELPPSTWAASNL